MKWKTFARWEVRRRAVVCGRALDAAGKPFTDGASLSLLPIQDLPAHGASKSKRKRGQSPVAPIVARRRFACHIRTDGNFFFLDVPAGNYLLSRVDAGGEIIQSSGVTLPRVDPDARMPVVTVDLEIEEQPVAT